MSSLRTILPCWCGHTVTQLGNLYLHVLPDLRFDEILVLCITRSGALMKENPLLPPLAHAGTLTV